MREIIVIAVCVAILEIQSKRVSAAASPVISDPGSGVGDFPVVPSGAKLFNAETPPILIPGGRTLASFA